MSDNLEEYCDLLEKQIDEMEAEIRFYRNFIPEEGVTIHNPADFSPNTRSKKELMEMIRKNLERWEKDRKELKN